MPIINKLNKHRFEKKQVSSEINTNTLAAIQGDVQIAKDWAFAARYMPVYLLTPNTIVSGREYYDLGCRPAHFSQEDGSPIWSCTNGDKVIGLPGMAYDYSSQVGTTGRQYARVKMNLHSGTIYNILATISKVGTPTGNLNWSISKVSDEIELASGYFTEADISTYTSDFGMYDTVQATITGGTFVLNEDTEYYCTIYTDTIDDVNYYMFMMAHNDVFTPNNILSSYAETGSPGSWTQSPGSFSQAIHLFYKNTDGNMTWAFDGQGYSSGYYNQSYTNIAVSKNYSLNEGVLLVETQNLAAIPSNTINATIFNIYEDNLNKMSVEIDSSDNVVVNFYSNSATPSETASYDISGIDLSAKNQWALEYDFSVGTGYLHLHLNGDKVIDIANITYDPIVATKVALLYTPDSNGVVLNDGGMTGTVCQVAYWSYIVSDVLPLLVGNDIDNVCGRPQKLRNFPDSFTFGEQANDITTYDETTRYPTEAHLFVIVPNSINVFLSVSEERNTSGVINGVIINRSIYIDNTKIAQGKGTLNATGSSSSIRDYTLIASGGFCGQHLVSSAVLAPSNASLVYGNAGYNILVKAQ